MEAIIANLIEKSLIGGAFVYLLHYFLGRFSTALENVSKTLEGVSKTLLRMNLRLDSIEKRMDDIEREGGR